MLFRILEKNQFRKLVEMMLESREVIGPKRVATDASGKPIHHFRIVSQFDEIDLGYETTEYSTSIGGAGSRTSSRSSRPRSPT
ncbi:MAG: hypothetical protein AB1486_13965 [Planctomycetota bacterium]